MNECRRLASCQTPNIEGGFFFYPLSLQLSHVPARVKGTGGCGMGEQSQILDMLVLHIDERDEERLLFCFLILCSRR